MPQDYVAEHVGLAHALTIHEVRCSASDQVLVLVVTERADPDEHAHPVGISKVEQLVQVLRRDRSDRSAHEVLREKLARSEDRALLRGLQEVLREGGAARVAEARLSAA